jgi:hypothetical protein
VDEISLIAKFRHKLGLSFTLALRVSYTTPTSNNQIFVRGFSATTKPISHRRSKQVELLTRIEANTNEKPTSRLIADLTSISSSE